MAIFHLHKRKRLHLPHLEDFPSQQKWKRFLDKVIYAAGIAGPAITIPQVIEIWSKQNAESVSLLTWSGYLILSIIWLTYGLVHKEKPLIIMFIGNIIVQFAIALGVILYG